MEVEGTPGSPSTCGKIGLSPAPSRLYPVPGPSQGSPCSLAWPHLLTEELCLQRGLWGQQSLAGIPGLSQDGRRHPLQNFPVLGTAAGHMDFSGPLGVDPWGYQRQTPSGLSATRPERPWQQGEPAVGPGTL